MVLANPYVQPRMVTGAALANQYVAGFCYLTTVYLNSQALAF